MKVKGRGGGQIHERDRLGEKTHHGQNTGRLIIETFHKKAGTGPIGELALMTETLGKGSDYWVEDGRGVIGRWRDMRGEHLGGP